jgi:hypothetical protein
VQQHDWAPLPGDLVLDVHAAAVYPSHLASFVRLRN